MLVYAIFVKKIKNPFIIINYKCGISNNYFIKNKSKPTKTNKEEYENHKKHRNIEKTMIK